MNMGSKGIDSDRDLSLALRLRAWWRGRDARRRAYAPTIPAQRRIGATADARLVPKRPVIADRRSPAADKTKLIAAQIIFGDHCLGPVGKADVTMLRDLLRLQPKARIAIIGGGLGGFGQALAAAGAFRVTSFDPDRRLVAIASRRRNLDVRPLPTENDTLLDSFDHVVIDGLSHRGGDVVPLIAPAAALAGAAGTLLIRTYVQLPDADLQSDRRRQSRSPLPAIDDIRMALDAAGFMLCREQSCAEEHVAAIEAAWRSAVDLVRVMHRAPDRRGILPALLATGEIWQQRVELIRCGAIDPRWILAARRSDS